MHFEGDGDLQNALNVIVCEPSNVQRTIICTALENSGFTLHAATGGQQALSLLRGGIGDILVTSVELPDMSGLELCWKLKTLGESAHIQTIVLSSLKDNKRLAEALDAGADDFLRKPIDTLELQARIRAAARIVRLQKRLFDDAHNDALTGVANRRSFMQYFADAYQQAETQASPVSVIMIDLDKFKLINDTHGHAAGDDVLVTVANIGKSMTPQPQGFAPDWAGKSLLWSCLIQT